MTRTRYTMSARSQGKLHMQRVMSRRAEKDVHRWVFVYNMDPDVETLVRKWLTAVEDYTWFEAFSEEGCATGVQATPAPHVQSKRKTIDERSDG